jgi:hypothetical protein
MMGDDKMTEAESIEGISALLASGLTAFTVFFSFTFAYLTVAYLAGPSLSKFQAIAVSVLYVASVASTGLTVFAVQQAMGEIQTTASSAVIDKLMIWDATVWHTFSILLFLSVITLSLYFMHDMRRKGSSER